MIEIRECSKAFGALQAVNNVSMDIGEREVFRTGWKQWRRKKYPASNGSRNPEAR